MKKKTIIFLAFILSACTLPFAPASSVSSPVALATVTPSFTPAPTLTLTPSPTWTPTPDTRVITAPAENFKLLLSDLPSGYDIRFVRACGGQEDPQCRLASDRIEGPHLNYEVMQDQGAEKGGNYINDTLRVEGWYIYYHNGPGYYYNPRMIMSNVIRFATVEGARKYMASYSDKNVGRYAEVYDYLTIGEVARAYVRWVRETKYVLYEFSYRNFVHRIWIIGTEKNITRELVHDLAFKGFTKLQSAELNSPSSFISPPTFTPQPDLGERVIAAEPLAFVLSPDTMPSGTNYHLADRESSSPYRNAEIIQQYQNGVGEEFIRATGRVDGWSVHYKRGANDMLIPEDLYDDVVMFQSAQGAQTYMESYADYFLNATWNEGTPPSKIGDATRLFIKSKGVYVSYLLQFSYRNYVHSLTAYGLRAEVDPAFMDMVAATLLRDLQSAELVSPAP